MLLNKFKCGTIFNPLSNFIKIDKVDIRHPKVKILYPSRLNAMALDPSLISFNKKNKYLAGEIFFSIKIFLEVEVSITHNNKINIINGERSGLIKHAAMIMKSALGVDNGFDIKVNNVGELKHIGLGSSTRLISSIGVAINEIYGNPIPPYILAKFLSQNHGEEVENDDDYLFPAQALGGSAISGMYEGGMFIIAGESDVIGKKILSDDYDVIIGYPPEYKPLSTSELSLLEQKNISSFKKTGKEHSHKVAYRLIHEVFPSLNNDNFQLSKIGNLIFDYRFKMGSINNCSFIHPPITNIAQSISFLKEKNIVEILSLSSVGPSFFAISYKENSNYVESVFKEKKLKIIKTKICNSSYLCQHEK